MTKRLSCGVVLGCLAFILGCNPHIELIYVDTSPPKATVLLNETTVGETPVKFEFDMKKPVTMKILKEGYKPKTELLNVDWVKVEYHQGHYGKGEYLINSQMQKGFEVHTQRELIRSE